MRYQTPTKKGEMQFCLARLKLQFTIYNITTNISVEESWKCTVWPKVFFIFFLSFLISYQKGRGVMSIFKLTFTLLRFYKCTILQSKGFMSTNCRIHLYFNIKKAKRKILQSLYIYANIYIKYTLHIYTKRKKGIRVRIKGGHAKVSQKSNNTVVKRAVCLES